MEEDWLQRPILIDPSLEENQTKLEHFSTLLNPKILDTLRGNGFTSLFPVQKAVLEVLRDGESTRDLLVSASTGSGKTLAYALPVINALSSRLVVRLRALIVVPGRELAHQVASVLEPFLQATGLNMAVIVGQTSLIAEQRKLVPSSPLGIIGGASNVDILIATPGRLVDHLQSTQGFSLQHLEWLVIDEADRLLDQNFQDWLPKVLQATEGSLLPEQCSFSQTHDSLTLRENQAPLNALYGLNCWATPLRKLLFSATLTKNPAKLAQLHLKQPKFLSVSTDSTKYSVPDELTEYMLVAEDGEKVHVLLHLLSATGLSRSLCFTKSVESTEKLCTLLQNCMTDRAERICAFSGDILPAKRTELLERFNNGQIDLLICSDGAARGLDLESVAAVISYDAPIHVKTYIHRVGRTARAGASGTAYSILEAREAHHFKQMLASGRAGRAPVQKMKIRAQELDPYRPLVEEALFSLQGDQLVQSVMQHFTR